MKIKTTNKQIKNSYIVLCCRYADMQFIQKVCGFEEIAYNSGVYGWNWDAIKITPNICIVTGYRNLCGQEIPYKELLEWENKASYLYVKSTDEAKADFKSRFIKYIENLAKRRKRE